MVLFLIGINFLVFGITGCSKVVLLQIVIILSLNHFISLRNAGSDFSLVSFVFVFVIVAIRFDLLLGSEIRSMIGDQINDLLCRFRVVLRRLAIDLILLLINTVLGVTRFWQ